MTFDRPLALLSLAVLAALVGAYVRLSRRRPRYVVRYSNVDVLRSGAPTGPSRLRRHAGAALLTVALVPLCVAVAGPWVVVPMARSAPRPQAQYQLTCPRGFVVAGIDAELSDQAIDLAFLGTSGTPVSPGVTTSRSIVFVASYAGEQPRAPTFEPIFSSAAAGGPTNIRPASSTARANGARSERNP